MKLERGGRARIEWVSESENTQIDELEAAIRETNNVLQAEDDTAALLRAVLRNQVVMMDFSVYLRTGVRRPDLCPSCGWQAKVMAPYKCQNKEFHITFAKRPQLCPKCSTCEYWDMDKMQCGLCGYVIDGKNG